MPKSKNSAKAQPPTLLDDKVEIPSQCEESTSSDQESGVEVSFNANGLQAPPQFPTDMFLPCLEKPCMDWTVNDGLYHRFLKWRFKCKNILECELAVLPECQKCKKVVTWIGDLGWTSMCPEACLRKTLAWIQFGSTLKSFVSPRWMKLGPALIYWQASDKVQESLMNGTTWSKHRLILPNTIQRLPTYYIGISFGFFSKVRSFSLRQSTKGVWTLTGFLQAKCTGLPRRWKASRPQQDILNRWLDIPKQQRSTWCAISAQSYEMASTKIKKNPARQKQVQHKNVQQRPPNQYKKSFDPRLAHKNKDRCRKYGDSAHLEWFWCPVKKFQCKTCHEFGHYTSLCFEKTSKHKPMTSTENPLCIS